MTTVNGQRTEVQKDGKTKQKTNAPFSSKAVMEMEHKHGAHNYHPLPVVFDSALGAKYVVSILSDKKRSESIPIESGIRREKNTSTC
ncbi:hypothetical protein FRC19_000949 [Serendipita sp. 401]|nr:hypothetical protein FRC19_000949 [Serendipita sp. 401]